MRNRFRDICLALLLAIFLSSALPMAACNAGLHNSHDEHTVALQQDTLNHDVTCLRECDAQVSAVIKAASSAGAIQQVPTKSKHLYSGLAVEGQHFPYRSMGDHPPLREFPDLIVPTSLYLQATLLLD